jgi:hypothetical protein
MDGGQPLFRFGCVTADQDDIGACGSHAFGHRTAKLARPADDHGRFSGETVYEPASNGFYPEFVLTGYDLISQTPPPIYREPGALNPERPIIPQPY